MRHQTPLGVVRGHVGVTPSPLGTRPSGPSGGDVHAPGSSVVLACSLFRGVPATEPGTESLHGPEKPSRLLAAAGGAWTGEGAGGDLGATHRISAGDLGVHLRCVDVVSDCGWVSGGSGSYRTLGLNPS